MPPISVLVLANAKDAAPTTNNFNKATLARELLDERIGELCENAEDKGKIYSYYV